MSLVEFEKHEVVKDFMDIFDVYHTNLGGYRYSKDGSPCCQLNGMLIMFEEQQKKIDLLETELTETQAFLNKQNHIKQTKIDVLNERHSEDKRILHNVIEMNQSKINELQARVDIALALIDTTSFSEVERRLPDFIEQLKDSLKGNKYD